MNSEDSLIQSKLISEAMRIKRSVTMRKRLEFAETLLAAARRIAELNGE